MRKLFVLFMIFALVFSLGFAVKDGGILKQALEEDPPTLDPAYASDVAPGQLGALIFDGLLRYDYYSTKNVPCLAESYEASADAKEYLFHLRKGVKFHNGEEMKASDVKYSFERILRPETKSPMTWLFDMIEGAQDVIDGNAENATGIEVIDDYTLKITLSKPYAPFLKHLAMPSACIVPQSVAEEHGEMFSEYAIGTGPFKIKEWKHDIHLEFEANLDYFEGRPHLDGVLYKIIPDELVRIAEFEAGNLDIASIPDAEFDKWTNDPEWTPYIVHMASLNTYYMGMSYNHPLLSNLRVREAIALAIDRKKILETVRLGRGVLAHQMLPPGIEGYDSTVDIPYDPAKAMQILQEEGATGMEFELWTTTSSSVQRITEAIQAYLAMVGINVKLVRNDYSVFRSAVINGQPDAYWYSWWADFADPYNFLFIFRDYKGRLNFDDPEYDALIDKLETETDYAKQMELVKEITEIFLKDLPVIPFYHLDSYTLYQPWVHDLIIHTIYNGDKYMTVWMDK